MTTATRTVVYFVIGPDRPAPGSLHKGHRGLIIHDAARPYVPIRRTTREDGTVVDRPLGHYSNMKAANSRIKRARINSGEAV